MRSILVIGGGIAGVETALTLHQTVVDAKITLATERSTLRMLPNLVYVPFGSEGREVIVPLAELLDGTGIEVILDGCQGVDVERRSALVGANSRTFDAIVVAPGVELENTVGHGIRTLTDAIELRTSLGSLDPSESLVIAVRVLPSCTWMAPAVEFSMLLAAWLRSAGLARRTDLVLATHEHEPLNVFGYVANDVLTARLRDAGISLLSGLPAGRVEEIEGDLLVDFAGMHAREIAGLPDPGVDGYYETNESYELRPGIFVVGDAASLPIKAGFATAWQARQVAKALGGDLGRLGTEIDGVPVDTCEYQMDLGGSSTLHARFAARPHLAGSRIGGHVSVWVSPDQPEKLLGTLLYRRLHTLGHVGDSNRRIVTNTSMCARPT